jgi:hypothetical protein
MMGASAVRELVTSIVVFEHFNQRSDDVRALMMLSLLSANHAREIAANTGICRGEEAYLLGLLRNIGEVLVACYLPDQYEAILADMAKRPAAAMLSPRRILHFGYEELAAAVLREWNLPDAFARVFLDDDRPDATQTLESCAHRLTASVYRDNGGLSQHAVALLIQKYSSLRLTRETVAAVLRAGIDGTRETFALAGTRLDDLHLKRQMMAAVPADPAETPAEEAQRLIAHVVATASDRGIDLNTAIRAILDAAVSAGGFDRAALALVGAGRDELIARVAVGRNGDDFVRRFSFRLDPSGGRIGVAVSRAQELVLARNAGAGAAEQRLLRTLDAGSFAVLPIVLSGRVVGAVYVDSTSLDSPNAAAIRVARHMRDAIGKAMLVRGGSASAGAA